MLRCYVLASKGTVIIAFIFIDTETDIIISSPDMLESCRKWPFSIHCPEILPSWSRNLLLFCLCLLFQPEDLFVQTVENVDLCAPPAHKKLKKSQCTPLFMNAYTMRSKDVWATFVNVYTVKKKKKSLFWANFYKSWLEEVRKFSNNISSPCL